MISHRELLHSYTTPLSDIPLVDIPDKKAEPTDEDFAELDAMIAKATKVYQAPQAMHKANLKLLQDKLSGERCLAQKLRLQQAVVVWVENTCKCGYKAPLMFQRYMEKWQYGKSVNWKTVEELDKRLEEGQIQDVVIKRESCFCGNCSPVVGPLKQLNEVVKGEKKDDQTEESDSTS